MSAYNVKLRFLKSVASAAILMGVYVCFRAVTSPFLDVEPRKYDAPVALENEQEVAQAIEAGRWFPNHSWVSGANEQYFDGGRVLYCESSKLSDDRKSVTLRPVAMQWVEEDAEDGAVPVTLVAESAKLNVERPISASSTELGRVLGGQLNGRVQIMGPRGLSVVGHDFVVTTDAMKLWSSRPVEFRYEGHRGNAASGAEIHLGTTDVAAGLMSVDEVRRIGLLGRVNVHFRIPARKRGDDSLDLRITAARGFTFDMQTRTGRFAGLIPKRTAPDGEAAPLKKSEQVWAKQVNPENPDETLNQLVCPELVLNFRNRVKTPGVDSSGPALELERLRAWGHRVLFQSNEHDLLVDGNDFQYSLDERRIDISQTPDGSNNSRKSVTVVAANGRLTVPHIGIMLAPTGSEVQRLACRGIGVLTGKRPPSADTAESSGDEFQARWTQALTMQLSSSDQKRRVRIEGNAHVSSLTEGMSLSAQQVELDLLEEPEIRTGIVRTAKNDSSPDSIDLGRMIPTRLFATGNVRLESAAATGNLRDKLTVTFDQAVPNPVRAASASATKESANDDNDKGDENVSFVADSLDARLLMSTGDKQTEPQFRDLWLKGQVEVVRQSPNPDRSFTASGNALSAASGLNDDRELHLFGDPAVVATDTQKLEGPRIDLQELSRTAEVVGSGRIRFVLKTGFDGRTLPAPTPVDLYWSDHAVFHERSADFVGSVRVVMSDGTTQDVNLTCAGMTVYFSEDVALGRGEGDDVFSAVPRSSADPNAKENSPVERVECHGKVTVHIEQFLEGVLNARHEAVAADLTVNLITGDFSAIGPGTLESVSPDRNGELQGSAPVAARANASAQTDETAFIHVKTTFIGSLSGNLEAQTAVLTQNVLATVTPTRRVDEKVDLQQVARADLPERAGILQAEELTMSSVTTEVDQTMFSVVARNNARLVAQSIAASADVITYDHSKEQFIMRADGGGRVKVSHRAGENGRTNRLTGNRFEYYRDTNRLKATEIEGLNIGGLRGFSFGD